MLITLSPLNIQPNKEYNQYCCQNSYYAVRNCLSYHRLVQKACTIVDYTVIWLLTHRAVWLTSKAVHSCWTCDAFLGSGVWWIRAIPTNAALSSTCQWVIWWCTIDAHTWTWASSSIKECACIALRAVWYNGSPSAIQVCSSWARGAVYYNWVGCVCSSRAWNTQWSTNARIGSNKTSCAVIWWTTASAAEIRTCSAIHTAWNWYCSS